MTGTLDKMRMFSIKKARTRQARGTDCSGSSIVRVLLVIRQSVFEVIVEVCVPVTVDCGISLCVSVRVEEIEERVSGIQLLLCHCV